jgi:hypothetical protein
MATTKIPAGCALCNRDYVRGHTCKEEPYTITKLITIAKTRKDNKQKKSKKT